MQKISVFLDAQTAVRVFDLAGRFGGRRLHQVPKNLLRQQQHVSQPVLGQVGLVLDGAVDAFVSGDHQQGILPQLTTQYYRARYSPSCCHVFLVLLDKRLQSA